MNVIQISLGMFSQVQVYFSSIFPKSKVHTFPEINTKGLRCLTLWALPFTLKSIFKAKEELWEFK
jgi:hypothetical protein